MRQGFLAIAAAAGLVHAPALVAQSDVLSRYSHWEQRLRDRINDQLTYPLGIANASGDVLVGFRIGEDGKPVRVRLERSSGYPVFDEAAVRLVSRLGKLGPVPSVSERAAEIVLKISYGDPSATTADSVQMAKTDWQEQLANERRDRLLVSDEARVAQRH